MRVKLFILFVFIAIIMSPIGTNAQHVWTDSLALTTTSTDTVFSTQWEELTFYFIGGAGYYKVGAPDTTSWASRKWMYLKEGQPIRIGSRTKVKRLELKMASGTGTAYLVGTKKIPQF